VVIGRAAPAAVRRRSAWLTPATFTVQEPRPRLPYCCHSSVTVATLLGLRFRIAGLESRTRDQIKQRYP
jgi:hypothetical protein